MLLQKHESKSASHEKGEIKREMADKTEYQV